MYTESKNLPSLMTSNIAGYIGDQCSFIMQVKLKDAVQ